VKTFQAPFVHGLCIAEKKSPPTVMVGGFLMGWNQAISCLNMSGGSARESNRPTPLVTRHNGFEVRSYSYQCVVLVLLSSPIRACIVPMRPSGRFQ